METRLALELTLWWALRILVLDQRLAVYMLVKCACVWYPVHLHISLRHTLLYLRTLALMWRSYPILNVMFCVGGRGRLTISCIVFCILAQHYILTWYYIWSKCVITAAFLHILIIIFPVLVQGRLRQILLQRWWELLVNGWSLLI